MLTVFGFERVSAVIGDIYFVDPNPMPGQDSAEHGVRLEIRYLEEQPSQGSVYAARPILVGAPLWRLDLLESVDGKPGSFDRTHHHPDMRGWEPWHRKFDRELSQDPWGYLAGQLRDLPAIVIRAEAPADSITDDDVTQMRAAADLIVDATRSMLEKVRAGELGKPTEPDETGLARTGWL